MVSRAALLVLTSIVLGCGPGLPAVDDETQATNADESSDDHATEPSFLDAESESGSESESSTSESSASESSTSESSSETTEGLPECGNGRIGEGEQCEAEDLDGVTCIDLGYSGGTLSCDPVTCTFDAAGCTFAGSECGSGVIDAIDEVCDGNDLGGQSCVDFGFVAGTLACTPPCLIDGVAIDCSHACEFDVSDCLVEGEASPCTSDADCPASAPMCTADACWNGAEGDPCLDPTDCMPALGCTNGECWDGSEGDPCLGDADCSPSAPQCAFGHCYDGWWGSPCASSDDCYWSLFCFVDYCTTL